MALSLNGSTGISGINGSAGTPVLQGGDADTGIFFGTDTASIATAGSERLIVDANGNINVDSGGVYYDAANNRLGIGTSSPGQLIQIGEGDTGATANVHSIARIEGRAVSGGQQVATLEFNQLTNAPNEFVGASIGIESSAGTRSESELVFKVNQSPNTDATEAVRLSHDGDLLFKQEAASNYPEQKLKWSNDSTTTNGFYISQDTNRMGRVWHEQGLNILFGTNNLERMAIQSDGKIGIGRSDPEQLLHLSSTNTYIALSDSADSGAAGILFRRTDNDQNRGAITYDFSNDFMTFRTSTDGAGESMRIDSSGNVGIGGTPNAYTGQNYLTVHSPGSSTNIAGVDFMVSGTREAAILSYPSNSESLRINGITNRAVTFYSNNTERMRLTSDGGLLFGRTSAYHSGSGPELIALQGDRNGMVIFNTANLNYYLLTMRSQYANNNNNNAAGTYLIFQDQGGSVRGSITVNTATSYNTTSDYRQKENIVNLDNAITRIKGLSPKRFNWIGRPSSDQIDGFIAHEAQTVVPEAVAGTHNEVEVWKDTDELPEGVNVGDNKLDDEGNTIPVMQGIDQSKLVPLLTAALQESITKIEALEAVDQDQFQNTSALLNQPLITFLNNSGAVAGEIIHSGVNSVTYATSSDHRLKENVTELTAAIPRLKNLAPKRFNFIGADQVTVDGFLAHEAQTVVPESVTGTHNEVDGDGNAVMQGIDQAKLVPLLTAALQEAITKIETLETKVAALEAA